jgi:hypothetical protein
MDESKISILAYATLTWRLRTGGKPDQEAPCAPVTEGEPRSQSGADIRTQSASGIQSWAEKSDSVHVLEPFMRGKIGIAI